MILIMPLIYILSIVFPCYRMITAGLIYIYKVCRTNYLALPAGPSNIMIFNTKCKKVDIKRDTMAIVRIYTDGALSEINTRLMSEAGRSAGIRSDTRALGR